MEVRNWRRRNIQTVSLARRSGSSRPLGRFGMSRSQHLSMRAASRRNPSGKSTISHSTRSQINAAHTHLRRSTRRCEIKPDIEIPWIPRTFSPQSRSPPTRLPLHGSGSPRRDARRSATTADDTKIDELGIREMSWGVTSLSHPCAGVWVRERRSPAVRQTRR